MEVSKFCHGKVMDFFGVSKKFEIVKFYLSHQKKLERIYGRGKYLYIFVLHSKSIFFREKDEILA